RKKGRPANRGHQPNLASKGTTTAPKPAETAVAVQPATAPRAEAHALVTARLPAGAPKVPAPATQPTERSWAEHAASRIARTLGSLQMAVILLGLFAAVVFLGTLVEHWYNTKIAQELVYRSWWFVFLLLLLAVNILFAAVKKWPWKKYQT